MFVSVMSSYQLNTSESADSQRVDDVEVVESQAREEGVLRFVPTMTHNDTFTEHGHDWKIQFDSLKRVLRIQMVGA